MVENFLIVQLADIGDLILSTPALSALREAYPEAHIALLTSAHSMAVLNGTNLVDEIIPFDRENFNNSRSFFRPANLRRIFNLRKGHYSTILFFHHFTLKLGTLKFAVIGLACGAKRRIGLENGNGWFLTERLPDGGFGSKHQAQYWLDLVGLLGAKTSPRPAVVGISPPPKIFNPQPTTKTIVIHPGSGGYSLARRWDAAQFAATADALCEHYDAEIVLVGGVNDNGAAVKAAMKNTPLDLIAQTSLNEVAGIIQQSDLYIGADSGVMHLAAAVRTPVIAIFGPSNAAAYGPWTPNSKSVVIRSAPECSPCSYVEHGIGLREGCAARTCMRMVTSAQVLQAAKHILDGEPVPSKLEVSPAAKSYPRRIEMLGLPVDAITYKEWLDLIAEWVAPSVSEKPEIITKPHHVCTINPEFMMIARQDSNFRNILKRADLCVPDGVGLLWAARYLHKRLPERVTGSDGVPKIAERAAQTGWRLFLLGAGPGVVEKVADVLCQLYPGLQIAGLYGGSPAPNEEDDIVERINASGADILFVAYGAPEQDKWIARNLPRLRVRMAMGVGGAFDFIAGIMPRAPIWMQRIGLEWLFRLYLQPWRIGRMIRLPRFVMAVLIHREN
jgi:N-acetylglucosaminyldiphosphoundecaprenol N-acetyl-beta-D-mannosaminyltransferase